ncbi:uncharacterized protein LOC125124110 [Phacochoerus africanus]|uniref:uncharacterized protein LOC125124110 n=1 Tax=Phacochoerus africanus TaxID=41426 RepID=UPI001FD93D27|nr:uncharacterized protein LOC125124110 [Phacochoerus africanus]
MSGRRRSRPPEGPAHSYTHVCAPPGPAWVEPHASPALGGSPAAVRSFGIGPATANFLGRGASRARPRPRLRPSVLSRAQLPRGQAAPPCPRFLRAAGPKRPWEGDEWHEQAPALPLAEISGSRLPTPLPKRLREGARLHQRRRRGEISGLSYQSPSALTTSRDFGKRRTQGRDPGSPPEAHPNGHNPPAPHRLGPRSSMHGRRARAVGRRGETNSLAGLAAAPSAKRRKRRPGAPAASLAAEDGWGL